MKQKHAKKSKQSDEYKLWESTPFISSMPCETLSQPCIGPAGDAVGDAATIRGQRGRPSKRLCDSPGRTTTATILEEPIKYLTEFSEKQGVSFDDVLTALLSTRPKKQKSNVKVNIPEQDATAFYFNNSFSTRSWTELRLFLLKFDVNLPPRNLIDNNKHELHPKVISHEIKCSVPYIDLVKDTVSGVNLSTDAGLLTGSNSDK